LSPWNFEWLRPFCRGDLINEWFKSTMLKILQYCMSLCLGSGILEYVGGLKFSRSSPSISRALQRRKGHSHGWSGSRNFFYMYSHNSDPVSSSKDPKMRPDSWHFMCLQTYPPRYPPVKTAGVAGAEDRQLGNDSTKPDASSWTLRLGLIFQVHTCIILARHSQSAIV
jgi:hypothetical protein